MFLTCHESRKPTKTNINSAYTYFVVRSIVFWGGGGGGGGGGGVMDIFVRKLFFGCGAFLQDHRRLGGESASQHPPRNREIVSFRSCVRARGVCDVISERKSPPCRLYLLSLAVGARIFYLLEIFYL